MVKTNHEFFMAARRRASAKRCQSYIEKERPDACVVITADTMDGCPQGAGIMLRYF